MAPAEELERERGERIEELLDELESLPAGERETHLARVCPDAELRREVLALLTLESHSAGYLERFREALAPKRLAPPDIAGKRIGPWRLLRPLGRGGMGVVYEAERDDEAFTQRVALKLLATSLTGTEGHQRFLAERRILAGLEHPAIARIVDGGVAEDGTPWFAMDRVDGEPVDAYCDRMRLGIRERLELFLQVCDAVDHAHRRLVVHRDIKPANVLVTEDSTPSHPVGHGSPTLPDVGGVVPLRSTLQVKLLDFGIARLLDAEVTHDAPPATRSAMRFMTPEYASPEQVRGEAVTTASDVYQLGLLLYELLTGHRPYALRRRRAGELERAICEQVPARPSTAVVREDTRKLAGGDVASSVDEICRARRSSPVRLRRRLRGDLDNIVLKALSKEPERRYGSADRLAQDLRRHLEGLPVTARTDTWVYRGRKFLQRHAVGASAAALAFVLAAGMVAFHMERIEGERDRAQTEAAKAQQMSQFLAGLFRSSDPREAQGAEITVREALDRGVEQVDSELAQQPEVRADMLHVLGRTYLELGLYDSANDLLTQALELRRRRLGPDHPGVAEVLSDIGFLRLQRGDFRQSRQVLEEAARIFETSGVGYSAELAEVLHRLGGTYDELGEYEEALTTLERALSVQRRVGGDSAVPAAGILNTLGVVLQYHGVLGRAERLYERALAIYERELDPDDPRIGFPLVNLAGLRSIQGKVDGVEAMYRHHLVIQQKAYGVNHPRVGLALNNLGDFLLKVGRHEEAISMLRQALEAYSSSVGPEHPVVAVVLSGLGDAELASGRPREARDHYRRSVTVRERALEKGQFDAFFAYGLVRLGGIEAELGDEAAAERNLNRAAAILRDAPDGVDAQLAPALLDLGRWLAERQRCDEAAPLLQRVVQIHAARQSPPSAATAELERLLAGCEVQPPTPAAG